MSLPPTPLVDLLGHGTIKNMEELEELIDETLPNEEHVYNQGIQLPLGQFETREDLINSVRDLVFIQGYAISIKRSHKDKYVVIGCDRGGNYRNHRGLTVESRKRKTASRLIDCHFEVRGRKKVNGPWIIEVVNASHNHDPSLDMSGHPSCRHFSGEEISRIKEMSLSGIPPRQILSSLRQNNPALQAISKTLYNVKSKIRKDYLCGRTVVEALFEEFGKGGFVYNLERDLDGHLTHLFFAHPTSMVLTKSYSNVFVMDCTYKTNKYKMPLLDIIGVSSFNTSFYSCFAFLKKEEERDYVWALQMFKNILGDNYQPSVIVSDRELALMKAIRVVFPTTANLLCVWHIEKNVLTNCKKHFKEGDDWNTFLSAWTNIVNSSEESKYGEAVQQFELLYRDKQVVVNYLKNTWLPFKEHFVSAWTEMHTHFGNRVTSRAEGAHANLKKYLQVSTGDLCEVANKIRLAIENQYQEIKAQLSSEKVRIPLFEKLITHVSSFALSKLLKQYEMVKSNTESPTCKTHFMASMGLPCAHKIKYLKGEPLHLHDIHSQWRLDTKSFENMKVIQSSKEDEVNELLEVFQRKYKVWSLDKKETARKKIYELINAPSPLLSEPHIQSHKGRPSGSKNKKGTSSIRRDPSAFEIIENTRKCSVCQGFGHNSRTCRQKVKDNGSNLQSTISLNIDDDWVDALDLNMFPISTDAFEWES